MLYKLRSLTLLPDTPLPHPLLMCRQPSSLLKFPLLFYRCQGGSSWCGDPVDANALLQLLHF